MFFVRSKTSIQTLGSADALHSNCINSSCCAKFNNILWPTDIGLLWLGTQKGNHT